MSEHVCLLDLDGTLTDPFIGISRCIIHALESLNVPVPEQSSLKSWIGPPLKQSFDHYLRSFDNGDADEAVRLYRDRFAAVGLFENRVYDGVATLLEGLHKHTFKLILATSKPTIYASKIVRHFELDPWFVATHGSELDGRLTNKTDLLAHIIEQHGLDPASCVMVGDREFDMVAARHHGMAAIGVLWGYGSPVELLEAGAETLVSSPDELGELLKDSI